jgi:hypothetical protein
MDAACCAWCIILIVIVIAVMMTISIAVPILTFRLLPTLDRPRIVLHGDQRMDLAEARIDKMPVAPVLHNAIRVLLRLLIVSVSVLPVGSRAKKTEDAKRTEY